jgi:hypothetical protein
LLETISPALRRRMQGKACFNFKTMDPAVFAELAALLTHAAASFIRDGALRPGC